MEFTISFKKEESYPKCNLHISDQKLHALQSLICSDVQFVKNSQECLLLSWLQNNRSNGDILSGNTCMVVIVADEVSVEDIFFDNPSKLYLKREELIILVKLWIKFCNDTIDSLINLNSVHFDQV